MNNYLKVKKYLEVQPKARERANKNRAIANLILEKYNISIAKETLVDIISEVSSLDRMWRKVTEENPKLRGKDYDEKNKIEDHYKRTIGYGKINTERETSEYKPHLQISL